MDESEQERLDRLKHEKDMASRKARWFADQDIYMKRGPRTHADYAGKRFGKLVGQHAAGHDRHGHLLVQCKCDCGIEKVVRLAGLRNGKIKSCGCLTASRIDSQIDRGMLRLGMQRSNMKRLVDSTPLSEAKVCTTSPTESQQSCESEAATKAMIKAVNLCAEAMFSNAASVGLLATLKFETAANSGHTKGTSARTRETLLTQTSEDTEE